MAIEKGRRGGLKSRTEREREQRERAKRSRTQLLGATQGGQRRPMRQGYTSSSVQPPPFRKSTVADDITQAGLAYKGGKGIFDWTQGTEGGYNKAGVWEAGKEPFAMPDFGGRLSQMGEGISNLGQNVWNNQPGVTGIDTGEFGSSWFGTPRAEALSGLGSPVLADTSTAAPFGSAMEAFGAPQNVATLPSQAPMHSSFAPTAHQLSTGTSVAPQAIDKLGLAGAGLGTGMSIYDMVDRGITPGNAMGLIGSLGVGASAFPSLGLAGLGPIGMGIGAIGGLGSLFDWW